MFSFDRPEDNMIFNNLTIENIKSRIKQKNIICFGAGKGFETFLKYLQEYNIENHIAYIVDNNILKCGTKKMYKNKEYIILSVEQMCERITAEDILIITSMDLENILMQLNSYKILDLYNCYFYRTIVNQYFYEKAITTKMPNNLKFFAVKQIPKVIHYCWFGGNPLPDRYKKWMSSWRKYCPDYEIIEWNESNYDISKNKYMKQAYDAKKWSFVSDYARLDIVYEYGGIYLDTDVELIRNIDELLYQSGFAGFQDDLRVATGLGFGAVPRLSIIKELRDQYENVNFVKANGDLNLIACPTYQTYFLESRGLKLNGEFQTIDELNIYPVTCFCGIMGLSGKKIITSNTFAVHHFDASWVDWEQNDKLKKLRTYT